MCINRNRLYMYLLVHLLQFCVTVGLEPIPAVMKHEARHTVDTHGD